MILTGTRNAGTDNDSYFDDLFVRLKPIGDDCEQLSLDVEEKPNPITVYPNPTGDVFYVESNAEHLNLPLQVYDQEGKILFASQDGKRTDLTSKNLMNSYLKHPLMTFKIILAIHFEAFKLWAKGIKFVKKKIKIKNNVTIEN